MSDPAAPGRAVPDLGRLVDRVVFDRVGVCTADPFPEVRASIEDRVRDGRSGGLPFTYSRPEIATDVRATFPWAERLVVGGRAYLPEAGDPGGAELDTGRIARFTVEDAYLPLRRSLDEVAGRLRAARWRAEVMCDDGRLVDRAAAVRAGIGWWGRNTMVLAPREGPWMLVGTVVTDAPIAITEPMLRDCGTCVACVPACPTGALDEPGVLDARRCLAAVLQQPGDIPVALRAPMGDRFYGCDDCLEACPPGRRLLDRARSTERGRVDLLDLLSKADDELLAEYHRFYVPRRDAAFLRRNALVALGNGGSERAVPVAAAYLESGDPMLRRHAAWALGRIGGSGAVDALRERAAREPDQSVADELAAALAAASREPSGK